MGGLGNGLALGDRELDALDVGTGHELLNHGDGVLQGLEAVLAGLELHLGAELLDGGVILAGVLNDVVLDQGLRDDVARRALGNDDVHGPSGLDGLTRTAEYAREHENGRHGNHGDGDKHAEDDGELGALGCSLRVGGVHATGAAVHASLGRRLNALRARRRSTSGSRGRRTGTRGVRCGSRGRSRGVRAESLAGGTLVPLIAMRAVVVSHDRPFVHGNRARPAGTGRRKSYRPYRASVSRSNPVRAGCALPRWT